MANWHKALHLPWILFNLLNILLSTRAQGNLCHLERGSSQTIIVKEDMPVGAIIGQINVVGDPQLRGDISLRLKDPDSPVDIVPGTKDLTLRKKFDKEGSSEETSATVTFVCRQLRTGEPELEIPIHIRVSDVNDNAPLFVNAPYFIRIPEVTVVGTRVLQEIQAIDIDQPGPYSTVRYSILPGPYSDYFEFENDRIGFLVLRKPLDYETLKMFDLHIRAQDEDDINPQSTDTVVSVQVIDADDQNPRFLDDRYSAIIRDPALKNTILSIKPRDIRAFDQDDGIGAPIFYTWQGFGPEYNLFRLDRQTAKITLAKTLNEHDLQAPAVLVIRATQVDNPDRYAVATLTVERSSSKGIRFLNPVFNFRVSEGLNPGASIGTLTNNRPGQHLQYFVSDLTILKVFAINTLGELSLKDKLDYETKWEYVFKVFATDGKTNDSSVVNITITNVNEWEPRFRYPHYEFFAGALDGLHDLVGRLEAADGDRGDRLTLSLSGSDADMFFITPNGELRLRNSKDLKGDTASLTVTAIDSGDPPKKTSVPVTVHFKRSEANAAVVSAGRNSSGPVLLAGLGTVLFILSLVVALLVAYICKVKRNMQIDNDHDDKTSQKEQVSNPMYGSDRNRPGTAVALGGIPSDRKSKNPSPKVHPAPHAPINAFWPSTASRVKKLSWGDDKTDTESTENLNQLDAIPKVLETNNLTVYF